MSSGRRPANSRQTPDPRADRPVQPVPATGPSLWCVPHRAGLGAGEARGLLLSASSFRFFCHLPSPAKPAGSFQSAAIARGLQIRGAAAYLRSVRARTALKPVVSGAVAGPGQAARPAARRPCGGRTVAAPGRETPVMTSASAACAAVIGALSIALATASAGPADPVRRHHPSRHHPSRHRNGQRDCYGLGHCSRRLPGPACGPRAVGRSRWRAGRVGARRGCHQEHQLSWVAELGWLCREQT